jgi:hypothetical protein
VPVSPYGFVGSPFARVFSVRSLWRKWWLDALGGIA